MLQYYARQIWSVYMFHGQTDETLKHVNNIIKIIFMCCLFYTLFKTSKMILNTVCHMMIMPCFWLGLSVQNFRNKIKNRIQVSFHCQLTWFWSKMFMNTSNSNNIFTTFLRREIREIFLPSRCNAFWNLQYSLRISSFRFIAMFITLLS